MFHNIIWMVFQVFDKKEPLLKSFDGVEDIVLKLLAGCILIYLCVAAVIPAIQDIPNIIFWMKERCRKYGY